MPLTGWFEKIQRNVALVLHEKELQNFLLNSLNSSKCFVVADTLPVYESLTKGLGSCQNTTNGVIYNSAYSDPNSLHGLGYDTTSYITSLMSRRKWFCQGEGFTFTLIYLPTQ